MGPHSWREDLQWGQGEELPERKRLTRSAMNVVGSQTNLDNRGAVSKPLILILCTANACRSQMGEAILQAVVGDAFEVVRAGCLPSGSVHEGAIEAMAEKGLDLREAKSQHMDEYLDRKVEIVITVCNRADEVCPVYSGQVKRHHWPFKDPALVVGTEEMVRTAFRRTRRDLEAVFSAYGRCLLAGLQLRGPARV